MSQSSLYHEHGISVYKYQLTIYKNGNTYVQIYLPSKEYRCPCSGSDNVWVKETVVREFRSVQIGNREFINAKVQQDAINALPSPKQE